MSRKNRNKNKGRSARTLVAGTSVTTQSKPKPVAPVTKPTKEIVDETPKKLSESAVPEADPTQPAPEPEAGLSEAKLQEVWKQLKQAEANYLSAKRALDTRLETIQSEKERLATEHREYEKESKRLTELQKEIDAREKKLLDEAEELAKKRADAEAGFLESRRSSLTRLEKTVAELTDAVADQMRAVVIKRQELINDITQQQQDALVKERDELEEARRELAKEKRRVKWDAEDLEDRVQTARQRAVAEAAGKVETLEARCKELEARLNAARSERDRLAHELESLQQTMADFGDRSPEALHADLRRYQDQIRALEKKLAQAPPSNLVDDYERIKTMHEAQAEALRERERQLAEQRESLNRAQIAVTELESIRDQRRVLEQHKRLLEAKINELESRIEELIEGEAGRTPFPSCRSMDDDRNRQQVPPLRSKLPDLENFVSDLQIRIAWQSSKRNAGRTLYYSKADLRSFIAGMAMSPLHILQGISGTGKTSLPLAVAEALGAGHRLIAVQAGWRDRQDLIGHYNTFEKRYYETEFLQALYEAQTPEYRDRVYIVVLDEMNLSHPEQYFADLLSELERPEPRDRHLDLMTAPVQAAPTGFVDGRRLPIPDNVWFVGTANHDETTKDFADKTYDRAHIMELPRHREEFQLEKLPDLDPLSVEALRVAFGEAQRKHASISRQAYEFLDYAFTDLLGDRFGLSWGNRLERQAELYIPVILAAGGTMAEAIDHLLATKVLRKLRNRHDIRPEYLKELQVALVDETGKSRVVKGELSRSVDLVSEELRRLGMVED